MTLRSEPEIVQMQSDFCFDMKMACEEALTWIEKAATLLDEADNIKEDISAQIIYHQMRKALDDITNLAKSHTSLFNIQSIN